MKDQLTTTQQSMGVYRSPQEIQIRLDTSELQEQVQADLTGELYVQAYDEKTKKSILKKEILGDPLANKQGIRCLMAKMHSIVSRPIVMGNIKNHEEHAGRIADLYEDMADLVYLNLEKWEIDETKAELIIEIIMDPIDLFLTRLIEDKERTHLGQDNHSERVQILPKGGFSMPSFGRRERSREEGY